MYEVTESFVDRQDGMYTYFPGDEYPRKGYEPTPERIEELSGNSNVRGNPLIKKKARKRKNADRTL